jgi:hypothetical protein
VRPLGSRHQSGRADEEEGKLGAIKAVSTAYSILFTSAGPTKSIATSKVPQVSVWGKVPPSSAYHALVECGSSLNAWLLNGFLLLKVVQQLPRLPY